SVNGRSEPILTALPILNLDSSAVSDSQVLPQIAFGQTQERLSTRQLFLKSRTPTRFEEGETEVTFVDPCAPPIQNPIVCENSKPGSSPLNWDVSGAGDSSIQGFASEISVNKGETVNFKIRTNSADYRADIYRLGYYGGLGARKIASISPSVGLPQ